MAVVKVTEKRIMRHHFIQPAMILPAELKMCCKQIEMSWFPFYRNVMVVVAVVFVVEELLFISEAARFLNFGFSITLQDRFRGANSQLDMC